MGTDTDRDRSLVETFATTGIVKLTDVFSDDAAGRMRDVVWRELADVHGARRDDPSTWSSVQPDPRLPRAKRDPAFRAILGEPLRRFARDVLDAPVMVPDGFGNLLVSFPDAREWRLPGRSALWHVDVGKGQELDPLPWLRVFAVFGDAPPGGGGTLLVAGSHRLVGAWLDAHPITGPQKSWRTRCFTSDPWLGELTQAVLPDAPDAAADEARRRRFMDEVTEVDGVPLQVVEVCGRPGDVFVCHPLTVHCRPPNASDRPRFVRAPFAKRKPAADGPLT